MVAGRARHDLHTTAHIRDSKAAAALGAGLQRAAKSSQDSAGKGREQMQTLVAVGAWWDVQQST